MIKTIKLRLFLLLPAIIFLFNFCVNQDEESKSDEDVIVGAIRWDAWHTPRYDTLHGEYGGPVKAMERSLSPKQYHFRVPFFGEILSDSVVRIAGYTQDIVDREIKYAAEGGLDYWAFLLYDPDGPMSEAISLYRSSEHKDLINYCAIASMDNFGKNSKRGGTERLLEMMGEESYQKVDGGRPLLYIFRPDHSGINALGGPDQARDIIDQFRESAHQSGYGDPYIVLMHFKTEVAADMAQILGAEAISCYAIAGDGGDHGTPYSELTEVVGRFWETQRKTGLDVVPTAMAGWDRRPRIEHPVPWERSWQEPYEGMEKYFALPSPKELANHVSQAVTWVREHDESCPAQAVIIYSWNEHDEGGWLCPTLTEEGGINTLRLDELSKVID